MGVSVKKCTLGPMNDGVFNTKRESEFSKLGIFVLGRVFHLKKWYGLCPTVSKSPIFTAFWLFCRPRGPVKYDTVSTLCVMKTVN